MSLAIDVDKVSGVLLADGWHEVADESFCIDAYEFLWEERVLFGGGQDRRVAAAGFSFFDPEGRSFAGPLTSVLAVRSSHV